MKKAVLSIFLILVMVFTSGCFSSLLMDDTKEHTNQTDTEETSAQDESEQSIASEETSSIESSKKESSKTPSKSNTSTTSSKPAQKKFDKYVMSNYKGMTIKEVIKIWGPDYTLANELYRGGWGYIYYIGNNNGLCFFFNCAGSGIPSEVDKNATLTGVGLFPYKNDSKFRITSKINPVVPYSKLSKSLKGSFWEDELDGGYSYTGTIAGNIGFYINWQDVNSFPGEITLQFN